MRSGQLRVCAVLGSMFLVSAAPAEPYVSFQGQFQIDLPADWERLDYNTVDFFLSQSAGSQEALDYDAAFATKGDGFFFDREYMLLTVDTTGRSDRDQVDSILAELQTSFNATIVRQALTAIATQVTPQQGLFDPDRQLALMLAEDLEGGMVVQKTLLALQFYERGIVTYYFYAPESTFTRHTGAMAAIMQSFTPETLAASAPEPVPVAEIDKTKSTRSNRKYVFPAAGIVVILIAIAAARRRRKRKE